MFWVAPFMNEGLQALYLRTNRYLRRARQERPRLKQTAGVIMIPVPIDAGQATFCGGLLVSARAAT